MKSKKGGDALSDYLQELGEAHKLEKYILKYKLQFGKGSFSLAHAAETPTPLASY